MRQSITQIMPQGIAIGGVAEFDDAGFDVALQKKMRVPPRLSIHAAAGMAGVPGSAGRGVVILAEHQRAFASARIAVPAARWLRLATKRATGMRAGWHGSRRR